MEKRWPAGPEGVCERHDIFRREDLVINYFTIKQTKEYSL